MTERRQQWIEEMESEYAQLTQQLEQFTAIDEKRKQLAAAIRALKGEKGVKGRPGGVPDAPTLESVLREHPGLSAKELAVKLGVGDGTVINRLKKLQERGVMVVTARGKAQSGYPVVVYSITDEPAKPSNGRGLSGAEVVKGLLMANPNGATMEAIREEIRKVTGKEPSNGGHNAIQHLKAQGAVINKTNTPGGVVLYKLGK